MSEQTDSSCSLPSEGETTRATLFPDGRVYNIPISWTTSFSASQLRRRFNLDGGGFDLGLVPIREADDLVIGDIPSGQLYFRDFATCTSSFSDGLSKLGELVIRGAGLYFNEELLKAKTSRADAQPDKKGASSQSQDGTI